LLCTLSKTDKGLTNITHHEVKKASFIKNGLPNPLQVFLKFYYRENIDGRT
jgi:hypothetical protein